MGITGAWTSGYDLGTLGQPLKAKVSIFDDHV